MVRFLIAEIKDLVFKMECRELSKEETEALEYLSEDALLQTKYNLQNDIHPEWYEFE